jgi:hypothetical protein
MTKADIVDRLATIQDEALNNLKSKLEDTNKHYIEKELELPIDAIHWGYIASMAIDLDYVNQMDKDISELIRDI